MELFNPYSREWLLNKFEVYKNLRTKDKAYYSEEFNVYVITRYADVMYALTNHDIFSSGRGNLIVEEPERFGQTLGASDNPTHDIFKNIVKKLYVSGNFSIYIYGHWTTGTTGSSINKDLDNNQETWSTCLKNFHLLF